MTRKEWDKLRVGDRVQRITLTINQQTKDFEKVTEFGTIERFAFGGNQSEIKWDDGFVKWHGRTSIEPAQ